MHNSFQANNEDRFERGNFFGLRKHFKVKKENYMRFDRKNAIATLIETGVADVCFNDLQME